MMKYKYKRIVEKETAAFEKKHGSDVAFIWNGKPILKSEVKEYDKRKSSLVGNTNKNESKNRI